MVLASSQRFVDEVALVIGGAVLPAGAATARQFASEGARMGIADVNLDGAEQGAASLPKALAAEADTTEAAEGETASTTAKSRSGKVDLLFNNAGTDGEQRKLHERDQESWEKVRGVNGDGSTS